MSDLIAAYLFLAGAGAGTALLAVVVRPAAMRLAGISPGEGASRAGRALRRVDLVALAAALVLLTLGALCLFFDLGRPEAVLKLFTRPTPTLITFGAWSIAILLAAIAAALALRGLAARRPGWVARVASVVVSAVVVAASACVMAYAGLMLSMLGTVPLWSTPLLPALFVASALACGSAVIALSLMAATTLRPLHARLDRAALRLDVMLVAVELVVAAAYVLSVALGDAGPQTLVPLLTGRAGALFIGGFAVCGLAAPLALDALRLRGALPEAAVALACAATLAGALFLRLALIGAGALPAPTVYL